MHSKTEPRTVSADWSTLIQQFRLTLRVSGRSPRTLEAYELAIRSLLGCLEGVGLTIDPADVTSEHIRIFLSSLVDSAAPATVNQRYRSLHRFFAWLVTEGERQDNPVSRIPTPKVPVRRIPALSLDDVRSLLKACNTRTLIGSRNYAMVITLIDTGLRASEFLSMRAPDDSPEIVAVIGKGNRERVVRLGEKAQLAVLRYQRVRQKLGIGAGEPALWVNRWGRPLTRSDLLRTLKAVGEAAGVTGVYTHLMRHTFATLALDAEAPTEAVRVLMGHTSDAMLRRYTSTRDVERALALHRRFSPGDAV
jgi:integrase/recombinase XerC/integrase/recombinase XerD